MSGGRVAQLSLRRRGDSGRILVRFWIEKHGWMGIIDFTLSIRVCLSLLLVNPTLASKVLVQPIISFTSSPPRQREAICGLLSSSAKYSSSIHSATAYRFLSHIFHTFSV